jgi:quercetin dioxygenase-like cupin family protein
MKVKSSMLCHYLRFDPQNMLTPKICEIAPGGHTTKHTHAWEHEIFVHSGSGEIFGNQEWSSFKIGDVVLVPGNEEHQIKNTGSETLTFICLVPSSAPEL